MKAREVIETILFLGLSVFSGYLTGGYAVAATAGGFLAYRGVIAWNESREKVIQYKELSERLENLAPQIEKIPRLEKEMQEMTQFVALLKARQSQRPPPFM